MKKMTLAVAVLGLSTFSQAAEPTKFEFWYGLTGQLGEAVNGVCELYNQSQDQYEAICVGQGDYDQAMQNTIAAFRANKQPTVVQAVDSATLDLMLADVFYPMNQMMDDFQIEIDWKDYFPAIMNYYASSKGDLFSMPFNSSTAVMYYNKTDLKNAGISEPPKTWEEFEAIVRAIKKQNPERCTFGYQPESWIDLEQFSMIHGEAISSKNNGYDGLDARLLFNKNEKYVKHMENIKRWYDEDLLEIKTEQGGMKPNEAFIQNQCSFLTDSIASYNTIRLAAVEGLDWGVTMLPVYEGTERKNSVVGGASLWVLKGKSDEEYRAAADFLKFVSSPIGSRHIVENTGYIPTTQSAQNELLNSGFYDLPENKGKEIAITSLTFTPPTELTRGIRLGGWRQIRTEWVAQIQSALAGDKTMQEALDATVEKGDAILSRFERTYKGKQLP